MKTILAALSLTALSLQSVPAASAPAFSTGDACPNGATSRVPVGSRQVLLSNPSKVHLAATLYSEIDKPAFTYVDADGVERRSHFPYHYQVFIPPNGKGSIGCTKIFVGGGEAAQKFVLQKTDYFLTAPMDNTEEARAYVGFIGEGADARLINLHATKALHLTLVRAGKTTKLDIEPQAISVATFDGAATSRAQRPIVTDARF